MPELWQDKSLKFTGVLYIKDELKLSRTIHSILWKLEKVEFSISTLEDKGKKSSDPVIEEGIKTLSVTFRQLVKELYKSE